MSGGPVSADSMDAMSALDESASFEEVAACRLCSGTDRTVRFREGRFSVVECGGCGLVYVTPRLRSEALPEVYGDTYWRSDSPKDRGYADYVADEALYLRTYEKRLRLVERFASAPGRALDVGCAAGYFLKVLGSRGWQVAGVELSPAIARHAREVYGIEDLHVGELATAPFEERSFDLVTFWDVVEHVPDPVALLRRGLELLKDDGYIVIETQNVASRFAGLLGHRWQHYKHLEHLYHFSPATLRLLLDQAGLEAVHQTARYAGKHVSVDFIRERATRLHPVMGTLLAPLAPLKGVQLYVNLFDELIVIARKAPMREDRSSSGPG